MQPRMTRAVWTLFTITIIFMMLLVSCRPSTPEVEPSPTAEPPTPAPTMPTLDLNALYNTQWVLAAYGDPDNPTVPPASIQINATFTPDGLLAGSSGCNNYQTGFQASTDGTMTIQPEIATTFMACPDDQMEAEQAYLQALAQVTSFNFTADGNLTLRYQLDSGEEGLLVYGKGAVPFTNTEWVLVSYGDPANPTEAEPGIPVTAIFSDEGQLSGISGCNSYSAGYTVEGETLTISPIASTMMMCTVGMEQETAYLQALSGAESYQITGQTLVINYTVDGTPGALTFSSANLPLVGTLWTLASMNGIQPAEEVTITAVFEVGDEAGSGTVAGQAACNNYTGGYTVNDSNLTIGALATTMMMCEETIMQAEQEFLQTFQATQTYQIIGNTLLLQSDQGMLTFTAERTPLLGALWQLVSLGDPNNPTAPVEGSNFTAQFIRNPSAPMGVLSGTTGCNEFAAAYAASLNEIKINQPISTGITTCVPGLLEQEQIFFLALNNATQYTILGDTLIMPYDDNQQALVFQGTQLEVAERPVLSDLDGSSWYLWSINDQAILPGTTITAIISVNPEGASGVMNGSAGCNTYQAEFGEQLGVTTTLTSGQFCNLPAGVMTQEQNYINTLARAYGYWQTGDQLILNSGSGVLTYRTTMPPAASDQTHLLINRDWFLVSFNTNFSLPGEREPSTRFNQDGTLNGYTGCNTMNGSFTTNINQITISGLSSTKMACTDQALQNQEQAMLAVLGSAQTYQVNANNLQIVGAQGVLNYSLIPLTRPEEAIPPSPVITAPDTAPVNTAVSFDATATFTTQAPIARYSWDFGDGGRATGAIVTHVYTASGDYRVLMTAIDTRNLQATTSHNIQITSPIPPTETPVTPQPVPPTETPVTPQPVPPTETPVTPEPEPEPPATPPTAAITGSTNGFIGEPVSFSAAGSTQGSNPIATYQFDFGDGVSRPPSADPNATYLYNHGGTYQVTVTVTDASGLSSSASMQVSINSRLDAAVWTLSSPAPVPGTAITLQFLGGQVAGFAGCNTYSGGYTATDNGDGTFNVTTSGLVTSQLACPQQVMQQETNYLASLGQVTTAQISGNTLSLSYPGGALTYIEVGTR